MPQPIDLRSDTVTRPTPAMRQAMAQAEVGDDVLGDDPTVTRLERTVADRLGKEAALFMPSGTMANQVAVRLHCRPGDELLCDVDCHIYTHEQGAFAQLSGVVARTIDGHQGVLDVGLLRDKIRGDYDHMVRTRLLCVENTHNRGGGHIWPEEKLAAVTLWARENGLRTHLDGARLFNAVVASRVEASRWCQYFDTVSVCFSKGLGAPVGSVLAGPGDWIREARRHRKLFGGGMRQVGMLAAGALHALDHHVERLADDHANAQRLADGIRNTPGLRLTYETIDTNIVFFDLDSGMGSAVEFVERLRSHDVWMLPEGERRVRALTHLDVAESDIEVAVRVVRQVTDSMASLATN